MSCNRRLRAVALKLEDLTKEEERAAIEFLDGASVCKGDHEDESALFSEYGAAHKTIAAARKELVKLNLGENSPKRFRPTRR
jgi:hypothetical protein